MAFLKFILLFFSYILFFNCISYANFSTQEYIKVEILSNQKQITIASDDKYCFIYNNKKYSLSEGKIKIELKNNKAIIFNNSYSLPIEFISTKCFLVNNKIYRGNIIISSSSKGNNIINKLKIEDYLKGVLPKEVNSSWNQETLKAQAVISRTYALKNIGKHSKENFDVCSSICCQVYGGASCEAISCNKAIYDTCAQVLFYKDDIAQTFFHASCGGHTENPKYVWQCKIDTPPYLKGRKDPYCKKSPHQKWTITLEENFIREKLIKAGHKVGKIKKISTSGKTPGEATEKIIIKHSKGKLKINSYTFRLAIDSFKIKSTAIFNIKNKNKKFIFEGKGWGHKVGLCQWGAKVMGEQKISYKKILEFYYPKTNIKKINYVNK